MRHFRSHLASAPLASPTRRRSCAYAAVVLLFFGSISLAAAQNTAQPEPANPPPAAPNETKKDTVPPATDKSEATRAGTQEPSSKVRGTESNTLVFANGVLAVPGAPTNVDTAPAKFSSRTAADDALPIAGYVLRHLTQEQQRTIFQSVRTEQGADTKAALSKNSSTVGALVPTDVALNELRPLPERVIAAHSELQGVVFVAAGENILLINPRTRVVVGVLGLP
jgi:hypothetical protein